MSNNISLYTTVVYQDPSLFERVLNGIEDLGFWGGRKIEVSKIGGRQEGIEKEYVQSLWITALKIVLVFTLIVPLVVLVTRVVVRMRHDIELIDGELEKRVRGNLAEISAKQPHERYSFERGEALVHEMFSHHNNSRMSTRLKHALFDAFFENGGIYSIGTGETYNQFIAVFDAQTISRLFSSLWSIFWDRLKMLKAEKNEYDVLEKRKRIIRDLFEFYTRIPPDNQIVLSLFSQVCQAQVETLATFGDEDTYQAICTELSKNRIVLENLETQRDNYITQLKDNFWKDKFPTQAKLKVVFTHYANQKGLLTFFVTRTLPLAPSIRDWNFVMEKSVTKKVPGIAPKIIQEGFLYALSKHRPVEPVSENPTLMEGEWENGFEEPVFEYYDALAQNPAFQKAIVEQLTRKGGVIDYSVSQDFYNSMIEFLESRRVTVDERCRQAGQAYVEKCEEYNRRNSDFVAE